MVGKSILHYRIIEEIGRGGMGVVYKAEDTKLKRDVAIKFLPRQIVASEEDRARFKIEAQAAAALNHPNIATIHAIEEYEDDLFLVMEYIEGRELRDIVNIPLNPSRNVGRDLTTSPLEGGMRGVLDYASQIASGLKAAHEKGIVHRDVKSSNIMITDKGQVKIMDFGLAKIKGGPHMTRVGSTLGTPYYMSPEQARGDEVDARTDIWAFGVVLYEMLTGQLPFQGEYEQAVIYSILNEEPKPISEPCKDTITEILLTVVHKALQKDSNKRYMSMDDLLLDLRQPPEVEIKPLKPEKSIVVLPFENMSPDPDNEYFSDGLTEEIITDLSQVKALRVISRASALKLKGTDKDIKTIGRELQVQYVLGGSVRKAGNNIRITSQLIDAASDAHLWAGKYSGTLEDVFDIQEKVSRSIVDALKLKLEPEEKEKIAERAIPNAQAFECYLRARPEMLRFTKAGLNQALRYLESGIDIIGENVRLTSAIGFTYWQFVNGGISADTTYLDKAETCAQRVLEIDPESVHGHHLLGCLNLTRGNIDLCITHLKRALASDPNDSDSLGWLTMQYSAYGKDRQALELSEKLMQIDPLIPFNQIVLSAMHYFAGRFDAALEPAVKGHEMEPESTPFVFWHGYILACLGQNDEAFRLLAELRKVKPLTVFTGIGTFFMYAIQGKTDKARACATAELKSLAENDLHYSYMMVEPFALINEKKQALDWLEHAVSKGFINYPFMTQHARFIDNIRGEKRFTQLMEKVKQRWEAFTP